MAFARRFFSRPTAIFGFAVFAAIVVIALAAPLIFAHGPFSIVGMPLLPPGAPGLLAGSDVLGRDMAVGLAFGARISLLVAAAGGIWLGSIAARRPGSAGDGAVTVLSMLFYAVPQFWLGMMAVLVFAVWLGCLPPFGIETMGAVYTGLARIGDIAQHMILPGMTLALYYLAGYARLTRAAMIEVADQDFVKTARAKGISEGQVARRHILRNALIPLVTYAGLQASLLVGGSVLVENVFSWPGVGTLAYEAVTGRDNPLLLGIFIVTAILVCLFNLITDIAYSLADPRVELGR